MKKFSFSFKYSLPPGLKGKKKPKNETPKKYPLIPIRLYSKHKKTRVIEGLIDSGSDVLFIPKGIADYLNLPKVKKVKSTSIGGLEISFETKVGLILGRGGREVDFGYIKAVFPEEEKDIPVLIGRHPVFDEFQIIF